MHSLTFVLVFMYKISLLSILTCLVIIGCIKQDDTKPDPFALAVSTQVMCSTEVDTSSTDYDATRWTELTEEDGYFIDVKYATTDNFVKEIIYPCGRMFLRPAAAEALAKVKWELLFNGYKLKLFDGYRPRPAQQKLWDKVPDPNYVARPSEGSMHNRGVAIDLTLADLDGRELDMGTPYDFFGREAHQDYTDLPQKVLDLRQKLKTTMEANGFQSIRTEWWHFSYTTGSYPLEDWQWPCQN